MSWRNYKAVPGLGTTRRRQNLTSQHMAVRRRVARRGYSTVPRTRGPLAFGEMKYFDTEKGFTSLVSSQGWTGCEFNPATTGCFFCPVPGTAINNRVARKALLKRIRVHGMIAVDAQTAQTTTDQGLAVRILFVQDTQCNGTGAQAEQVMDATALSTPITAFQNLDTLGRFKVLYDKVHTIQPMPTGYTGGANFEIGGAVRHFKISIKFKEPVVVNFNATAGGTFADIVDNNFMLLANCNNINMNPDITYTGRCYFQG